MNYYLLEHTNQAHYRDLLREAEAMRIASQVAPARPASPDLVGRIRDKVATILTSASHRLTEHPAPVR
jgi:hypothetical protein